MNARTTTVSDITERLQSEFGPGSGSSERHEWLVECGPGGAACTLTLRVMELARQPEVVITSAGHSGHPTQLSMPITTAGHLAALIDSVRQWTCTARSPGRSAAPPGHSAAHKPAGRDAASRGRSSGSESEPPAEIPNPSGAPDARGARSPPFGAPDRLHHSPRAE